MRPSKCYYNHPALIALFRTYTRIPEGHCRAERRKVKRKKEIVNKYVLYVLYLYTCYVYVCIYVYVGRQGRNMNGRAKSQREREGKGERANEERKMPDEGIDETKDGTYERDT